MSIYCRVTIDGMEDEMSTGCKILYEQWDEENKQVTPDNPLFKAYNKKLEQIKTDLEHRFDLVVAQSGLAMPQQVLSSYKTPIIKSNLVSDEFY